MGARKKPKKYSKMGYQQKEMYVKEQLKELGGSGVYYDNGGARGSASTGMFDLEASEEQLKKLASNDYDRRESLKYGVDSGDKRFKGLDASSGFDSMEALVNTDRAINKYGYNKLGHKNMSSDADMAAVSSSLFNKSRDKFSESITSDMDDEQTDNTITPDPKTTYKTSPETVKARETVKAWQDSDLGGAVYGTKGGNSASSNQAKSTGSRPVSTNVDDFIANYKNDVYKGAKMRPNIPV